MVLFKKIQKKFKEPAIFMVRHGHTKMNGTDKSEDRIRGHIDVPLNDEGIKDAHKASDELKNKEIDGFFSSDLDRAKETCEIIHENYKSLPIIYSSDLRPWNLGVFQGQKTEDVINDLNAMVKHPNIVPTDGESFNTYKEKFLKKLISIASIALTKHQHIVIVSHFRCLKLTDAWISNGARPDLAVENSVMINDKFKPGEIFCLDMNIIAKGGSI